MKSIAIWLNLQSMDQSTKKVKMGYITTRTKMGLMTTRAVDIEKLQSISSNDDIDVDLRFRFDDQSCKDYSQSQ